MLATTLLQLKSLRLLDASCNEITGMKGLSENKVNVGNSHLCLLNL